MYYNINFFVLSIGFAFPVPLFLIKVSVFPSFPKKREKYAITACKRSTFYRGRRDSMVGDGKRSGADFDYDGE